MNISNFRLLKDSGGRIPQAWTGKIISSGHQHKLNSISGPLMDRIDLHVEVVPVLFRDLTAKSEAEKSETIRNRVMKARKIQESRYRDLQGVHCNAQLSARQVGQFCKISDEGRALLQQAMERLNLSARAYTKILKVSRTIADLESLPDIQTEHLAEAIQYRSLDRESWGN